MKKFTVTTTWLTIGPVTLNTTSMDSLAQWRVMRTEHNDVPKRVIVSFSLIVLQVCPIFYQEQVYKAWTGSRSTPTR